MNTEISGKKLGEFLSVIPEKLWNELNRVRRMSEHGDLPEITIDKKGTFSKTPEQNGENWTKHYQGISSMKPEDQNFDTGFCKL